MHTHAFIANFKSVPIQFKCVYFKIIKTVQVTEHQSYPQKKASRDCCSSISWGSSTCHRSCRSSQPSSHWVWSVSVSITVWFSSATKPDISSQQSTVWSAERIIGVAAHSAGLVLFPDVEEGKDNHVRPRSPRPLFVWPTALWPTPPVTECHDIPGTGAAFSGFWTINSLVEYHKCEIDAS